MHGPLSEIGLIEVLQLLERGGRSGVLRVVGPDRATPHIVYLAAGRVVALTPDADDAAVRRALIRRAEIVAAVDDSGIDASHFEAVRTELARHALGTMLHWDQGRFDFQAGAGTAGPLDLSPDTLVLDLVDAESRRAELADALADWHVVPVRAPITTVSVGDPVALDALAWRVLDAVDGRRDVAALAAQLDESVTEVGARIRSLEAAAILQLEVVTAAPPVLPQRAATTSYDDAVARLQARLRVAPDDGEAWRTLGLAEVGAGRFDRAVTAWRSWQQAVPAQAADATALIRAAHTMMEALRETRD